MAAILDNLKIGTTSATPTDPVGTKDAVHTAIILVRAGQNSMKPGDPIGISSEGEAYIVPSNPPSVAVIDPFIKPQNEYIKKGTYFWAFLRPSIMEGVKLRHEFKNPPALAHLNVPILEEVVVPAPKNLDESQIAEALGFEMRTEPLDPEGGNTCNQCEAEIEAGRSYFTKKSGYTIFCSLPCLVEPVHDECRGCY